MTRNFIWLQIFKHYCSKEWSVSLPLSLELDRHVPHHCCHRQFCRHSVSVEGRNQCHRRTTAHRQLSCHISHKTCNQYTFNTCIPPSSSAVNSVWLINDTVIVHHHCGWYSLDNICTVHHFQPLESSLTCFSVSVRKTPQAFEFTKLICTMAGPLQ